MAEAHKDVWPLPNAEIGGELATHCRDFYRLVDIRDAEAKGRRLKRKALAGPPGVEPASRCVLARDERRDTGGRPHLPLVFTGLGGFREETAEERATEGGGNGRVAGAEGEQPIAGR